MVANSRSRLAVIAQALVILAESPRGMATSTEIAEILDVHPVVLRRLLGVLRSDGILESRLTRAEEAYAATLDGVTLASLMDPRQRRTY